MHQIRYNYDGVGTGHILRKLVFEKIQNGASECDSATVKAILHFYYWYDDQDQLII